MAKVQRLATCRWHSRGIGISRYLTLRIIVTIKLCDYPIWRLPFVAGKRQVRDEQEKTFSFHFSEKRRKHQKYFSNKINFNFAWNAWRRNEEELSDCLPVPFPSVRFARGTMSWRVDTTIKQRVSERGGEEVQPSRHRNHPISISANSWFASLCLIECKNVFFSFFINLII